MAIPSKQVGQSAEANLLWQIARQLQQLTQVTYTSAGGSQNLQQVTDLGATTTNTITAQKLIKQGGTSTQFLKANGDVDSTVYAPSASPTFTGTVTLPKTTTINTYSPIVNIVKDSVPTTPITGTLTETIFNSYLIPANTFSAMDMMKIPYFEVNKIGTVGNASYFVYINTSNTLTGATRIMGIAPAGNLVYNKISRQFNIYDGSLTGYQFSQNFQVSDIISSTLVLSNIAFNPAINNWIITTGKLSLASESIQQKGFNVTN